ncbi:tripartite tricarboxylate transporter substrate binding protein [Pseudoroseomonas cervicalis]|uniref:Bug family tripartite tricarboxylate transporter substrate binding protein n=1 Tax=Teichococcus cervicalis TaxID=204525 RepID=UPI0022F17AF2|nr:tripartite tricarboxylate transporter substrate binding protein [Pseudoroseomonas cervicalis]WBV43021.1 tripartite tricarboxylate transporter substrate binding protein [Pseudoroseomonas cervicalis]
MSRTPTLPRRGLAALAALPLLPAAAAAQTAPPPAESRPLRLVVPFPPGGALDLLARLLAERLGPALGRTVVVDNRAGAGGVLGADAVAKAAPDGATIGLLGLTTWTAMPFMFSRLPFDPAKDFTPLSLISAGSLLCVVNAETASRRGWGDFRALIAWARANPDKVTMGSSGTGTSSHLCLAAVNKATGAGILHVPYRGGGPAIQDLLSGNIDMMFDVMPALMPHVTSGRLKALAVSSARPVESAPGVPGMADFADLGLGHVDIVTWNAIAAPAGLPAPLAERLAQAVRQAGAEPEFRERLRPLGYEAVTSAHPRELEDLIAQQLPIWRELVEISGARLD